jgi:excisionase family DNA binding protein
MQQVVHIVQPVRRGIHIQYTRQVVLDTTSQQCHRVGMPDLVLLTTTEVAQRFRVDSSQVRRWVAAGKLRPSITTPGGHYRFNEADIDAFEVAS